MRTLSKLSFLQWRNTIYQGVLLQSVYGQLPPRSWSTIGCQYPPYINCMYTYTVNTCFFLPYTSYFNVVCINCDKVTLKKHWSQKLFCNITNVGGIMTIYVFLNPVETFLWEWRIVYKTHEDTSWPCVSTLQVWVCIPDSSLPHHTVKLRPGITEVTWRKTCWCILTQCPSLVCYANARL